MNVVNRVQLGAQRRVGPKRKPIGLINNKNNTGMGILGPTSLFSIRCAPSAASRPQPLAPRYQFTNDPSTAKSIRSSMGPPTGPVRSLKKRWCPASGSGLAERSPGGAAAARVLACNTTADSSLHTPRTPAGRPAALRYVSSSSRGRTLPQSSRSTTTSIAEPSVVLAITEGRGIARGEIGLAAVDLRSPHLVLCQFSDSLLYSHTLTKVNYFNPVEIIVPHTFCEATPTPLYRLLRDRFPSVTLSSVQRRHYNDALGRRQVQSLCAPAYSAVYMQLLHKFYALTAAAAVLKYVEYIQCVVFARESLKIEYHCSENTMLIDVDTATQLELVSPLEASAGASCCLLGVLGPTYTAGGVRALRAAILQPPSRRALIEERLDCVQELVEHDEGLASGLQDVMKKLCDVEKILFLCLETPKQELNRMSEAQMNQTLLLKTTMELVPALVQALSCAHSGRLRKIKMDLENAHYKEIADRIKAVIQDDARMEKGALGSLQRSFAVRPEINGLLDVARRTYSELVDDIQRIVEALGEAHELPVRLNQNALKGFHIVMPLAARHRANFSVDDLPPVFIQVKNNGASVTMTTEELVVLDQQAKESLNEILSMSNIVIYGLLKELRPFMGSLYKLCEDIAELDVLLALARASSVNSYVRPEFNEYIEIRNGVHPLLDYNSQTMPVANDIFASPEYNLTIVTGPNMSGKSIYIKQVALLHVMAQIGCFVPATNAVLRLTDHLFSRIGFNDSVELNASTYVLEMKEIQHILKDLTPTSLVVIDELCSLQASVGEEVKPNSAEKILVYNHKVTAGVTKVERYGLALAKNTNLPELTVKLAEELADVIADKKMPESSHQSSQKTEDILLYKLNADIKKEMRKSSDHEGAVKNLLELFRNSNPALMQKFKAMEESKTEMSATSAPASSKSSVYSANSKNKCENIFKESNNSASSVDNAKGELINTIPLQAQTMNNFHIHINNSSKISNIDKGAINKLTNEPIHENITQAEELPVKNTTQLLNTIPQDYYSYSVINSCDREMLKTNDNIESSSGSDFQLDEDFLRAIDEIESDHSMQVLQKETRSSNTYQQMATGISLQVVNNVGNRYDTMSVDDDYCTTHLTNLNSPDRHDDNFQLHNASNSFRTPVDENNYQQESQIDAGNDRIILEEPASTQAMSLDSPNTSSNIFSSQIADVVHSNDNLFVISDDAMSLDLSESISNVLNNSSPDFNENNRPLLSMFPANIASQSTVVLGKSSQRYSTSGSSMSSIDAQLFIETVAEIHNNMQSSNPLDVDLADSNAPSLHGSATNTDPTMVSSFHCDIILPPPIEFAD